MNMQKGKLHLVRYGIAAEQKYLSGEFLPTYDCLVINGNSAALNAESISSFIGGRLRNKPFLIDPLTHVFQHDTDFPMTVDRKGRLQLKRSFKRLVEEYGPPTNKIEEGAVITPRNFKDSGILKSFSHHVCSFQLNIFQRYTEKVGLQEYYKYVGLDGTIRPVGVVAPYFFMTSATQKEWLKINIELLNASNKHKEDRLLLGEVVIDRSILDSEKDRADIIQAYGTSAADALLVWVDDLSEHEADPQELASYKAFLVGLGDKKPVILLYGSFFATALMIMRGKAIKGVCHGIQYGEDRPLLPAGGGLPTAKYYFPALHSRLRFADAYRIGRAAGFLKTAQAYWDGICSCKLCKQIMKGKNPSDEFQKFGRGKEVVFQRGDGAVSFLYPTTETRDLCTRHYMWNKADEFRSNHNNSQSIVSNLKESSKFYKNIAPRQASQLEVWVRLISD